MSADNLTYKIQKKAYFLFVINLITRSKKICRLGRSLKICGTIHSARRFIKTSRAAPSWLLHESRAGSVLVVKTTYSVNILY